MALDQETINAQLDLLATHRRTLAHLLQQAAQFGGEVFAPPQTANGIAQARQEIWRIKAALSAGGVAVEDAPNDVLLTAGAGTSQLAPQEKRNRSRMLDRVEAFWVKGVLEQSLYQIARLELGLEYSPAPVSHPWETVLQQPNQPNQTIPVGKSVAAIFDDLLGEMLVLGAPGAGKTTILLELARDLIARARSNQRHPIPVVFNLSTWAIKRQSLDTWLVEELNQRYDVPRKLAQEWVAASVILPLLDGLDEVVAEHRNACVGAINAYRTAADGFVPLVVCSRINDYEALNTKLRLQGALVIQPLTKRQVDDYLKQVGRPLAAVRAALHDDTALWELIENPLLLSIVALAYKDTSPAKLRATATPVERRRQLFDDYIAAMLQRRSKETRYPRNQALRWLSWLAQAMSRQAQTEFLVERLQPEWLPTRATRLQYVLLDRLGGGLVCGLVFVLLGWLVFGLVVGLVFGFVVGLFMLFFGGQASIETLQQRPIGRTILDALAGALVSALVSGLVIGLFVGLLDGVVIGLVYGLAGALIGVLTGKPGLSPRRVIVIERLHWVWRKATQSAVSGLGVGLGVGLVGGLVGGLLGGLGSAPGGGLLDQMRSPVFWRGEELSGGLVSGLVGALLMGLNGGLVGGLAGGLLGGLSTGPLSATVRVNQGIKRSARSALNVGLVGGLLGGLVIMLISAVSAALLGGQVSWLGVRLIVVVGSGAGTALISALSFGGYTCLSHLALRLVLSRKGSLPLRLVPFLDYCVERIFLRKVGGGYIFVHRLLMEHFASLYTEQPDEMAQRV
jgi:hypothetical protein